VKRGQPLLSFKAGIDSSDELYPDLVTFAPVSGVVGVKLVKQGEQVVSSMGTINPVFSIYQIDNVKIYVNVAEKYASDLSTGLTAELKFDSMPDQTFKGIVNKVRPVLDSYSRTVQVEILVRNPKHLIKPGMFARVELMLQHKIKALVVPADAIMEDVSKYVLVSSNGQAVKKDIQTGVIGTDFVEVVSGIASTDSVIIVGQRVVKAGSQIEVKND
jgi:cobalt-zinc-cadmium efflux system membrane fusion protein